MSDGLPKLNAARAVAVPLAAASQGVQAISKLVSEHQLGDKLSKLGSHSALEHLSSRKELLLAVLGLVLVLHGAQFKNIILVTQLVLSFLYVRVRGSVMAIYNDIKTVVDKAEADAPQAEPAKESNEDQSKHAKKRDAKKEAAKAPSAADTQAHIEASKKVLKALDSERLTNASTEVMVCLMACLLVLHGGLAQRVAISYALVAAVAGRVEGLLHFEGFEDVKSWTSSFLRFALWVVILPMAIFMGPLALILNVVAFGADLATQHGMAFLAKIGKVPDADAILGSPKGLMAFGGLVAFGTLWQVWSWAAGSGMAWYFQMLYLPAIIAEGLLGLL